MIRESIFEQLRRIPEDLQQTYDRIENWGRWSKDRLKRGHCQSIEHKYKSTDAWQDTEPQVVWDALDAEELHSVVCGLPERYRWLLHLLVLHKAPDGYVRRVLGIRRDDLVSEYHRAIRMVRNVLRG